MIVYIGLETQPLCFVSDKCEEDGWIWAWRREISENEQLYGLLEIFHDIQATSNPHPYIRMLDSLGCFIVNSTRKHIDDVALVDDDSNTRWYKIVLKKVNIFIWRLILHRLPWVSL